MADRTQINARRHDGQTPLHLVVRAGRRDVAALLRPNEADFNAVDQDGWTPLHFDADWGDRDMERLLPSSNPDVSVACSDKAQLPLANKADVNARNDNCQTPLQVVALKSQDDLVRLLREYGVHE
jgi:ankyrin repeat protein